MNRVNNSTNNLKLLLKGKETSYSLKTIIQALGPKGYAMILLLGSLPFSFPIVLPGLSTPFGLLLLFVSYCYIRRQKLWIPTKIAHKHISHKTLDKMVSLLDKFMHKMRHLLHQRFAVLFKTRLITGALLIVQSIFMAIPFPLPLTNTFAALPIVLIALALLSADGLLLLIGYASSLLAIAFFTILFWFGVEGLERISPF